MKDIDDATRRNAAVIELQEKILDAQQAQSALIEKARELEKEVLAARDALVEWIAKRTVRCDDKGPDKVHPDRRIGICFVEGKELNEWLVRQGWALNFEPYAKGRYLAAQRDAEKNHRADSDVTGDEVRSQLCVPKTSSVLIA